MQLSLLTALLALVSYPHGVNSQLFSFLDKFLDDFKCPRGQRDLKYLTALINQVILGKTTYLDYIPEDMDALTTNAGGRCNLLFIRHSAIKEQLGLLVAELADGTATRGNDLGLIRLSETPFDCRNSPPWSEGYCGIGLGMPFQDHEIVRPFMDEILGDGSIGGDVSKAIGNRFNRTELIESARLFIDGLGNEVDLEADLGLWIAKTLHKVTLNIDLSDEEAKDLAEMYPSMLLRGVLPNVLKFVPFGRKDDINLRRSTIESYEDAIRALIADGSVTSLVDENDNVKMAAWGLFDAFTFAGFPSLTSITWSTLGTFYNGQIDESIDLTTPMGMGLALLETIRLYPPVLGVTRFDKDGIRHAAVAGVNGFDTAVYGEDALEYRVRLPFEEYQDLMLNWADAALPLEGRPSTSHVCPAKSLSFNIALSFLLALNPAQWAPESTPPKPEIGSGPNFWEPFKVFKL